ncbi:MAG: hypothetical protein ACJASQ_001314 [Crocinitomicaceae bacterium]|jgi:hypothetical protein
MTLNGIFRGIGDFMQWTFNLLENEEPITMIMNYGVIVLGFVGLAYWLNFQRKMTAKAKEEGKLV